MSSARIPLSIRDTLSYRKVSLQGSRFASNVALLRNTVFIWFLLRWTRKGYRHLKGYGITGTILQMYPASKRYLYTLFLSLIPGVKAKISTQLAATLAEIEIKLATIPSQVPKHTVLPRQGVKDADVRDQLQKHIEFMKGDEAWNDGKNSGAVYHGGKELLDLQAEAQRMFSVSNPLHPDVFPAVRKMDAEVVSMVLAMYNAPPGAAGTTTSGGTESILMACLAARNKAYTERGVTEPEIVIPVTAHAAFYKAGHYFKIKIHSVNVDPISLKVDLAAVSRLINSNTVLLVGSAPNFPHGIIDDIAALSKLALRHKRQKLLLHVDACLGSFIVPFLAACGFPSEPFDFRLKGVTSVSCDTHKYGFAPKGSSVVMYRDKDLRRHQYFVSTSWPGGIYASPTLAGSRPGALIAGAWASMISMGEAGYMNSCTEIVGTAKAIIAAIGEEAGLKEDLYVLGAPLTSVVSFTSKPSSNVNIYALVDEMSSCGWHLNALQKPPAIHIACTKLTLAALETFLSELKMCIQKVKGSAMAGTKADGSSAALYGVAGSIGNSTNLGIIETLAVGFVDTLYKA